MDSDSGRRSVGAEAAAELDARKSGVEHGSAADAAMRDAGARADVQERTDVESGASARARSIATKVGSYVRLEDGTELAPTRAWMPRWLTRTPA